MTNKTSYPKALAPYNFIDLNKNVLASDNQSNDYAVYHHKKHSGYIDLKFTALTDIFTRGVNENFQMLNGVPVFMGSSIRGPIRAIVEQMGYAEMDIVDKEEAFFYREVQIPDSDYKQRMNRETIKGGWLVKEGGKYKLYKAKKFECNGKDTQEDVLFLKLNNETKKYKTGRKISFKSFKSPENPPKVGHPDDYTIIIDSTKSNNKQVGVLVKSGGFVKKKKEALIGERGELFMEGKKLLELLNQTESDLNRKPKFSRNDADDDPLPIFYCEVDNQILALGTNYYFRIPYDNNTGKLIDQKHIKQEAKDFVTTIFGNDDEKNASKVFFEDFYYEKDLQQSNINFRKELPQILSKPRASYYSHYLTQTIGAEKATDNWNTGKSIRGYKNYWHRTEPNSWVLKEFEDERYFKRNDRNFNRNIDIFLSDDSIHLMVEVLVNNNEEKLLKELENFMTSKAIAYKKQFKSKKNKDKNENTTFYLKLKSKSQYEFLKDLTKANRSVKFLRYRFYYIDPQIDVVERMKKFQYGKDKNGKEKAQTKPIKTLPKNSVFKGRIRFDNLTDCELGLLLLAIDLPEHHAHKVGMGKPLGMGSVRFKITDLNLIKRKERYSAVFKDTNWNVGANEALSEQGLKKEKIEAFKNAYKTYFKQEMQSIHVKETDWESTERIHNLYLMLKTIGTDKTAWTQKTRYLELKHKTNGHSKTTNEFSAKKVLPKPNAVYKLSKH